MTLDSVVTQANATTEKPWRITGAALIYTDIPKGGGIERRYLLVQSVKWPADKWGLPHEGKQERDGCLEEAIFRGLSEELDIYLPPSGEGSLFDFNYTAFKDPVNSGFSQKRPFSSPSAHSHPLYGGTYQGKHVLFFYAELNCEIGDVAPNRNELRDVKFVNAETLLNMIRQEEREIVAQIMRIIPRPVPIHQQY